MVWLGPDDVLPCALRVLEGHGTGAARACIVRDRRGRIRLAAAKGAIADIGKLSAVLERDLGRWFAGPIIDGGGSPAHRRIAESLIADARAWPPDWPQEFEGQDGVTRAIPPWLAGKAILHSKESWLDSSTTSLQTPPRVVSFYSFKGGVGRTTALACVAARLALNRGLKVVVVDLDLEAPGAGRFLGATGPVGVVDHVLSHLATGDVGDVDPEPVTGIPGLWVLPAGTLRPGYVEKLSRLDFLAGASGSHTSPTEQALRDLLAAISSRLTPDVVLLDSRAGLHDLGGLALHRLSHADVLVARANAQAQDGMRIVLQAIRRLRSADARDVRLVQTMVPLPFDSPGSQSLIRAWRREMYDLCLDTIYEDLEEAPGEDQEAAHYPFLIGERDEFSRTDRLDQVAPELLPHFDPVADFASQGLPRDEEE